MKLTIQLSRAVSISTLALTFSISALASQRHTELLSSKCLMAISENARVVTFTQISNDKSKKPKSVQCHIIEVSDGRVPESVAKILVVPQAKVTLECPRGDKAQLIEEKWTFHQTSALGWGGIRFTKPNPTPVHLDDNLVCTQFTYDHNALEPLNHKQLQVSQPQSSYAQEKLKESTGVK